MAYTNEELADIHQKIGNVVIQCSTCGQMKNIHLTSVCVCGGNMSLSNVDNYWKRRCKAAEQVIKYHGGIKGNQVESWLAWREIVKERE